MNVNKLIIVTCHMFCTWSTHTEVNNTCTTLHIYIYLLHYFNCDNNDDAVALFFVAQQWSCTVSASTEIENVRDGMDWKDLVPQLYLMKWNDNINYYKIELHKLPLKVQWLSNSIYIILTCSFS